MGSNPTDHEQLGAFYLGRSVDAATGETSDTPLLYDSKDLTTHAVIVGMTGSGKTGLGVALLEEAAIDGVPAIVIDPKGDLTNLALNFPRLAPEDFRPWIDSDEALREGRDPDEHARVIAERWREGLARWGQDGARVARLADAAQVALYTPGSASGRPLAVFQALAPPARELADDPDALAERLRSAASGLLALVGIAADPLRSREHVLISALLDRAWRSGRTLDLASLVRELLDPGMDRVGVLDLEAFFPATARAELAMRFNAVLASPSFAAWSQGEPLDVASLLTAPDGRPRLSVLSLSHLGDAERMFFVTMLLEELVGWMRSRGGTQSLRALLYMDEVMGYLPPSANPPSKGPMLTLLKQARAAGLGVVLSTQNPVDLDYKALSNAGTWFLGRLQTERDRARVLDGLEGTAAIRAGYDRAALDTTLAGLGRRTFFMHDVHEDAPIVFRTRWCLSYLRGPLPREQLREIVRRGTPEAPAVAAEAPPGMPDPTAPAPAAAAPDSAAERPVVAPEIRQAFLPCLERLGPGEGLEWRPALSARATLHHARARPPVDHWREVRMLALLGEDGDPWEAGGRAVDPELELQDEPDHDGSYAPLPPAAARPASYRRWEKRLAVALRRDHPLELLSCDDPKLVSEPGEAEADFVERVRQARREQRDLEVEKLRSRHAPKLARLTERIRKAEQHVEKQREQYQDQKVQAAISVGTTVLGALFGRKLASVGNVGRAGTTARRAGRVARERGDVERALESAEALRAELAELEERFAEELAQVRESAGSGPVELGRLELPPRKTELDVRELGLLWTPWRVDSTGRRYPAHPALAAS